MKLDFRIDWGYHYLYSRRHYHPTYIWDGDISCTCGNITEVYQLDYPLRWFGLVLSAKETKLEGTNWKSTTKWGMSGVRIVAEVLDTTEFYINTITCKIHFSAKELLEKGRLEFPVGPKYLGCSIMVTRRNYLWFRTPLMQGERAYDADDFGIVCHDWARMHLAWLESGQALYWNYEVPECNSDFNETLIHIVAMAVPKYSADEETQVADDFPLDILCDGEPVLCYKRHYRFHDDCVQLLEDDFKSVSVGPGKHVFGLKNNHENLCLGISRITMRNLEYKHGELRIPQWCLKNESIVGKVFSATSCSLAVRVGNKEYEIQCEKGWNEFGFSCCGIGNINVYSDWDTKIIEVFDVGEENPPIKVGFDMTAVPHNDDGFMDFILDYTHYTRLGNYVVFRSFLPHPVEDELLYKWGDFCRKHGIYVSAVNNFDSGALANGAKEMFHDCGTHEHPSNQVYSMNPTEPYSSKNMKEASEKFIDYLKIEIDRAHKVCNTAAFGDASGGIRYSFLAGVDFVRAETMGSNTMTLLSQARPAAEALGKGNWAVHIPMQHPYQPYHETHLGQYFLSLMQPWIMGAECIYEEDSLFGVWKEERQAWDDFLAKGKRNMTRSFFKFVKTHPRQGKCIRNIAFVEGRYAAPFNGFICVSDQDPHYSVWGMFGNNMPQWGHTQPEKCRHLLDVLMPGACTLPMRQKFDKRRFYFSGTPYGDFDCIPTEADITYFNHYKLLIHCGWNTMIYEDYRKLKQYAENGGTVLISLLQFSTHTEREFLRDMEDISLWNNGDLSDICGIKVHGKGSEYLGQWNSDKRDKIDIPELSSMPNDSDDEDGKAYLADITLCGAEIIAWESEYAKPMLVRYKIGKGYVYTFTFWAYPGHEKFQSFSATWINKLSKENLSNEYVVDSSGEVFWTRWVNGNKVYIALLNTDWSTAGNIKTIQVIFKDNSMDIDVRERTVVIAEISNDKIMFNTYSF